MGQGREEAALGDAQRPGGDLDAALVEEVEHVEQAAAGFAEHVLNLEGAAQSGER